jgi:hypothetical protein
MLHSKAAFTAILGIVSVSITLGSLGGCDSIGGGLAALPLARITSVQLFDQPNYTLAFSVESALNNPGLVSKINWVFGDGTGFVEGADGRATITHKYAATGAYAVTAYVFQGDAFIVQITGTANVAANGSGGDNPSGDTLPGQISGPNPRDDATDVAVKTKLTWTADADATSHDVYLGKVEADVDNGGINDVVYQGTQTGTSFDPGGLDPDTQYFWRVDERNDAGAAKGVVLSFKTAKAPKKAKNFVPADGVLTVAVDQVLQWTAGTNATSHDVYFGKDQAAVTDANNDTPDIFIGNQSGASYDPSDEAAEIIGQLLAATDYYWRIDEVGLGGTVKGDTLHFRTADPPPAVTSPIPADGAVDVDVNTNLSWSAVAAITSFDVYFGTDQTAVNGATRSSSEYKGNQTSKIIDPGDLLSATTYYWRVDTLGSGGTAKGAVFAFTTDDPPAQVAGPFTPANHATNVSIDIVLAWSLGVGGGPTTSVDVYLGTDEAAVVNGSSSALKGNQSAALLEYDPLGLNSATAYFWRIDAVGPGGKTTGQVLRFQTGALPGKAESPSPANGAKGVALDAVLGWTAGSGATHHRVYFGTNQTSVQNADEFSAEFQGDQAGTTFDPLGAGLLEGNTTYYWRIDEAAAGGSTKGSVWSFTTVPGRAINPDPMDQDTGIALDAGLSWTAGAGAASHDVYFGTVENDVLNATHATVAIFKGNQSATTWTPPSLLSGTTAYYWRIDEVGAPPNGTTKGLVWRFTTGAGQAALPITPANGAVGVVLAPTLTWTAGAGAAAHDIYFGTTQAAVQSADRASAEYQGGQVLADTSFDVIGPLTGNTNYYWRIDELDALDNATKGPVWQFKTGTGPVSNPVPADLDAGIDINADLSWTAGSAATSHSVYFGTSEAAVDAATPATPGIYKGNQATTTFDPTALNPGTTYYWRIDEVGSGGTTKGEVWQFTTGAGQATNPSPTNGHAGVSLNPQLTWIPGALTESLDVYFGTTSGAVTAATRASAEFQGNQLGATFNPGLLTGMTFYYWRIDSVTADGTTKGEVWQFRTGPGKATTPTPADFATGVLLTAQLKWNAGTGAVWHDVYFSTSLADVTNGAPAAFLGRQTGTISAPPLAAGTTYYWRIDEVAANGTTITEGDVWRFTTAP